MNKIVIADASTVFTEQLKARLAPDVSARCCNNAQDLLTILCEDIPALLVMDLSLPGCDGIEMLHTVAAMENRPAVLATANYVSDFLKSMLNSLGIGYLLIKPCNMEVAVRRVRQMLCYYESNPVPNDLLHRVGICNKLSGAAYIRCALPFLMENPDLQLTKELYPMIGTKFGKNAQCIERSIRNAVHSTWEKHNGYIWQEFFDIEPDGRCHRPSNMEFFQMLLRLMQNAG